ncbi:MAG: hypothetical protein COB14_09155 [Alphaproteobacteria bacterium]|nr:MAG: hypothetical protein COB14_09155 [Alphaproteobacteria bacterium]
MLNVLSLKNWPMAVKMGLPAGILVVLILGFGYAYHYTSNSMIATMDKIVKSDMHGAADIAKISNKVYDLNGNFYKLMTQYASGKDAESLLTLKVKAQEIVDGLNKYKSDNNLSPEVEEEIDGLLLGLGKNYIGTNDDGIFDVAEQMIALDVGFVLDSLENYNVTYNALSTTLDRLVNDTVEKSELQAQKSSLRATQLLITILSVAGAILLGVIVLASVIGVSTISSINLIAEATLKLADGDHTVDVKALDRGDELKGIVNSLQVFKENQIQMEQMSVEQDEMRVKNEKERRVEMEKIANDFESSVGQIVAAVNVAAKDIQDMSGKLSTTARSTSEQSEMVTNAADVASQNVGTVAAAAEEMSASVQNISRNISETAHTAQLCSDSAALSQEKLDQLQDAMGKIDTVIQSISDVAEQTNLLALNATIEAARAGDAGKGFAVVASEVKQLATETHKMTAEISDRLSDIKSSANATISSVNDIIVQISEVTEKTTNIASAIEEQNNATQEISKSANEAATGTHNVTETMGSIRIAVDESSSSTAQLQESSQNLSVRAVELEESVQDFLTKVRTA